MEPGKILTFWVEVRRKSVAVGDDEVVCTYTKTDGDFPIESKWDRVEFTGIWCEIGGRTARPYFKVDSIPDGLGGARVTVIGDVNALNIKKWDWIALYDDDNTKWGTSCFDEGFDFAMLKVIDDPEVFWDWGYFVTLTLGRDPESGFPADPALPAWLTPNDQLSLGLSPEVNQGDLLMTFLTYGAPIGNKRVMPYGGYGIEIIAKCHPEGITRNLLSVGWPAMFDVAQQVVGHHRFDKLAGPDFFSREPFPSGDEKANDDGTDNLDGDNYTIDVNLQNRGLQSFDKIFRWDSVGWKLFAAADETRWRTRANFKSYVRVGFDMEPVGDNMIGSRCSDHLKWRVCRDLVPDEARPDGTRHAWKRNPAPDVVLNEAGDPVDENSVETAEWIRSDFIDALKQSP